jgi:hypothetical protein
MGNDKEDQEHLLGVGNIDLANLAKQSTFSQSTYEA